MDLLRWILAFYFMALSLMPCEDARRPSVETEAKLSFHIQESHSKDKGDVCSPLCSCCCCQMTFASFKMDPLFQVQSHVQAYFSKKILFHNNNFAYQMYDHIWQPPKI